MTWFVFIVLVLASAASGAVFKPGAWYAGLDATCDYELDVISVLSSPPSTELVTNSTTMTMRIGTGGCRRDNGQSAIRNLQSVV